MDTTIKISIQELVFDFEKTIRIEEHYATLEDIDQINDDDLTDFHKDMEAMVKKYMPKYKNHVAHEYFDENTSSKEKAGILCNMLQENFKEIFVGLI